MSPTDLLSFSTLVYPLKPWDDDGDTWGISIQDGQLTEDPELAKDWVEIRLEGNDDGTWTLGLYLDDVQGWEVYSGRIPDRTFFIGLLFNGRGFAPYHNLLLIP